MVTPAILGAVLAPLVLWGWNAVQTRTHALATAEADQRRITEALSQNTLKLLETQALVLDIANRAAGPRDCAALREDVRLRALLALADQRLTGTNGIWITDALGFFCIASDPALMDTRSRSFRGYFSGAREAGAGRFYVDRAVIGLIDGHAVFNIATPRLKDGAFNGVVVAGVNLTALTHYWRQVIGGDGTQRVALFREDGATIARSWAPLVPPPDPATEAQVATIWRDAPEGGRIGPSRIDFTRRVGGWRTLPDWHVVVTSSVAESAVLAPWRQAMAIDGVIALLASALLGALAWLLLRARDRLTRMVAERTGALRISEERLSLFIDRAPAAIAMFDTEMHFLAVSRRYLQDYGIDAAGPEAVLGCRQDAVQPDIPRRWQEVRRRVFAGETLSAEEELILRADGRTEWVRWEMAPWHRSDGTVGGAVLFSEVVTERKQAEQVLARGRDELERLVAERSRELAATQTRLAHAQRMEALGQLAGGIAHDFNNVIQAMQGAAALIERRPGDAERVRSLARMSLEASGRGAAITRRLLAFSRRSDLRAEPVDVAALLAGMQEILAHTLGAGIGVTLSVAPGLPPLLVDKGQLETVLVNLATNARDAMPSGGTLTLAATAATMPPDGVDVLPPAPDGAYVRLVVADTGSGMTPEVIAQVFEPFFTTKGVGQGTGLGLAMARGFVEQSGGGLHIASTPGHGTIVSLWFPLARAAPAAVAGGEPSATGIPAEARARLLMVDDDSIVRETLAQQMEAAGFAVLTAPGAAEALALLDAGEGVDLIVADLSMPGMDGITLLREARRHRPGLPGILLTGYATNATEIALGGAMSGAYSLLRKPIEGAALAARIAMLLDSERLTRAPS